ncbi:hypothetical protein EX30DRAFT_371042 [Ascodesmis nigricans]|uniref:Lysine-specific metallo-endopeptidase domain-containing protein n=1 Tax=Ascodesmis nigricans TaxID=341454 RepID=A0A4S2MZ08_9PEZI|nr:hypothetical protein EX30DRAFT_371042 [Ascodesmis nigricans]
MLPSLLSLLLLAHNVLAIPNPSPKASRLEKRAPGAQDYVIQDLWILNELGMRNIPSSPIRRINRWGTKIPEACVYEAGLSKHQCPLDQLDVFAVSFQDAPEDMDWLFCRCRDAKHSEGELIEEVGRLPVAVRQRVRYIMLFTDDHELGADSSGNDLIMRELNPCVIHHEAGHCFDDNGSRSGSAEFRAAIQKDTCYLDSYSAGAAQEEVFAEAWAQVFLLQQFMNRTGKKLDKNLDCMENQLAVVNSQSVASSKKPFEKALKRKWGGFILRKDLIKSGVPA